MNEKALRAGCAPRGAEVSCKQHRSGAKESQATLCSYKQIIKKEGNIHEQQRKILYDNSDCLHIRQAAYWKYL